MNKPCDEYDKLQEKIDSELKTAMADHEELLMKQIDELVKAAEANSAEPVKAYEELNVAIDELSARHSELAKEKAGIISRNQAARVHKNLRLDDAFMVPANNKAFRQTVWPRIFDRWMRRGVSLVIFCLLLFILREFMPQKKAALIAFSIGSLWIFVGFELVKVYKGDKEFNWMTLAQGLLISIGMIVLFLWLFAGAR